MSRRQLLSLTIVSLLIDRDANCKLPVQVFDWEQPILEEIHGEANVVYVDGGDQIREVDADEFDMSAAFEGLVAKYRTSADGDQARARYFAKPRDLDRWIMARQPVDPASVTAASRLSGKAEAGDAIVKPASNKPANGKKGGKGKGAAPVADVAPPAPAPAEADAADAEQVSQLLALDADALIEHLPNLSDAQLLALEQAETEGQGREDVLVAIDDEAAGRS